MSALQIEDIGCITRKVTFKTKAEAIAAATSLKTNRDARAAAFRCGWCDGYHVGNKSRGDSSKGRRRR